MSDAFAVNHHRTRQRQPLDARARHAGEQLGGAGIVGGRVVGQILHIDAEADLGGEMQHGLDAAERAIERARVAHIRGHAVRRRRAASRPVRMHVGAQRIEHAHLMAARQQLAQHMLADEAGAAGEKNLHRRVTAIAIVSSAPSGVPCPA